MSENPPSPDTSRGQSLPAGTHLEEFVIERVLGVGGFGITYLAEDSSLGRRVVIKENLPAQFCWRDTHALTVRPRHTQGEDADNFQYSLESFRKEASTLASLDHPGIVKVLRSFQAHGTAYFVMPFVEGIALDEVVRQRTSQNTPFTEAEITDLLAKVLDALSHLHDRGIYHRDLKPGNILMTKAGPVLIDFGAARQRLSERSLTVIESAGYTPFEQLQSRGKVGPWSDIYAVGGTLYKVITGTTPAKANDRAFDDPLVPLAQREELRGKYAPRLLESIDQALSPQISGRFQNAAEWQTAMTARQKTAAPQKDHLLRPVVPPPLPTVPTPVQGGSDNAEKHNRRKTLLEYSFAIFIAGLFLICIMLLLRQASPTAPQQTQVVAATDQRQSQVIAQAEAERLRMSALSNTSRNSPFTNSQGMMFVPAGTPGVLFSVWETRVQDFAAFVEDTGYDAVSNTPNGMLAHTLETGPQWQPAGGSWKDPHFPSSQTGEHPVVCVSYLDAEAFCAWLTRKEREAGNIPASAIYRLPADSEWSSACGSGKYPWGESYPPGDQDGNYSGIEAMVGVYEGFKTDALVKAGRRDSAARTAPVGMFKDNRFGLHDMGGNVFEWCSTWYESSMNEADLLRTFSLSRGDNGGRTYRVLRGASWLIAEEMLLRTSCRSRGAPRYRDSVYGFRCVLVVAGS